MMYTSAIFLFAVSDPSYLKSLLCIPLQLLYKWNIEITLPKQSILNFTKSSNVPVKVKQYCSSIFCCLMGGVSRPSMSACLIESKKDRT